MKKRIVCLILTLVMVIGLLPTGVFAAATVYDKTNLAEENGEYVLTVHEETTVHGGTLFTFTQNGSTAGSYSIKASTGYLSASSSKLSTGSSIGSSSSWTLTMAEGGALTLMNNKYYLLFGSSFSVSKTNADPIALCSADGVKLTAVPEGTFDAYICNPDCTKFLSEKIVTEDTEKILTSDYCITEQLTLRQFYPIGSRMSKIGDAAVWKYAGGKLSFGQTSFTYADGALQNAAIEAGTLATGSGSVQVQLWKKSDPAAAQTDTYLFVTSDPHYKYRAGFGSDVPEGTKEAVERLDEMVTQASKDYGNIYFDELICCGDMGDGDSSVSGDSYWERVEDVMETVADNDKVLGEGFFICGNHEWSNGKYSSLRDTNEIAKKIHDVGEVEETDEYAIFSFSAGSTSNNFNTEDIAALDSYLQSAPTDKPIFIVSHFPAHNYSQTIKKCENVVSTLNKYGDTHQIIFLWGHNHDEQDPHYGNVYTKELDGTPINFAYASGGCLNDIEYRTVSGTVLPKGFVAKIAQDDTVSISFYDVNYKTLSTTTLPKPEGHKFTKVEAKYATCTEPGVAVDCWYCSNCFRYFSDAEGTNEISADSVNIAALRHSYENGKCTRCGDDDPYYSAAVSYVKADTVEAGKSYVIVSNGVALKNQKVEGISTSSIKTGYSLAGEPVTIKDGKITSGVSKDLIWDFSAGTSEYAGAYEGKGFYIKPSGTEEEVYLRRTSGSTKTAGLDVTALGAGDQYFYWAVEKNDAGQQALFFYSEKSGDYIFFGNYVESLGVFGAPGSVTCSGDWQSQIAQYPIELYEVIDRTKEKNIDFTDPADAFKFTLINQTVSEIKEGEGLYMISTAEAFENAKEQLSGDAAKNPRDVVEVSVSGDWTATLALKVNCASNGAYEFLGFYGMTDYSNGVGIRAGKSSTVNFKAIAGAIESSTTGMKISTGLTSGANHWYKLEKVGTTYTGYMSEDGTTYQTIFTYENTGVEATKIVIDAYSGRDVGYEYWLQSLTFEKQEDKPCEHDYEAVVTDAACVKGGYTTYTCSKCGDSYVSDEVKALGHNYLEGKCTRCGAADPTYNPGQANTKFDILFMSDLHNGVGGYNGFKQMMAELKAEKLDPKVISHGGDYVEDDKGGSVDWQTKVYDVISGLEAETFPDAKRVYTMGNHDWESGTFGGATDKEAAFKAMFGFDRSGLSYSDDEFEIYMIGAQGTTAGGGGGEEFTEADINAFEAYLATKTDSGKVIFLQTHWPAHSSYNFKQRVVTNSDKLIDVCNKYADDIDIVWIWGHNHYEDLMRYEILTPGSQIMYKADTSGSSWGNPSNPQYKTIKFTYANAGCMNDMWYLQSGRNNTTSANNYRGPSACLSVAVEDGRIVFNYNRITEENGVWTFSHNADIEIHNHNVTLQHPSTVTVARSNGSDTPTSYYYQKANELEENGEYVITLRDDTTIHGGTLYTFTQNGSVEGTYSIKGGNGYVYATGSALYSTSSSVSSQASWTLTMNEGAVTLQNNTSSKYYILYNGTKFAVSKTAGDPIALYDAEGKKLTAIPEGSFEAYICNADGTKFLSDAIEADDLNKIISSDYIIADSLAIESYDPFGLRLQDVGNAAVFTYRDGKLYVSETEGLSKEMKLASPDAASYADNKLLVGGSYLTAENGALAAGTEADAVQIWKKTAAPKQTGSYLAITSDIHNKFKADFATDSETGEVIGTIESIERLSNLVNQASADFGGIYFDQFVSCGDQGDANTKIKGNDYWARVGSAMEAVANHEKVLGGGFFINGNHEWQNGSYNTYVSTNPYAKRIHTVGYVEETDNYILYSLSAAKTNNSFNMSDIEGMDAYLATAPSDKPIFIVSHYPLHNIERTEVNRDEVIKVLNKYADTKQIIFLWGHNHTHDDPYYGIVFGKDSKEIPEDLPIKFTYASAGCMTDDEYDIHAVNTTAKAMIAYIAPNKTVSLTYYNVAYQQMSTTTLAKPAGHHYVKVSAKPATCTETGIASDCWYCDGCGRYASDVDGVNEIAADTVVLPVAAHTLSKVDAASASCTKAGISADYWCCTVCGKCFSDEAGTTEITAESVVAPALGHTFVDGICIRCSADDPDYKPDTPVTPDDEDLKAAVEAAQAAQAAAEAARKAAEEAAAAAASDKAAAKAAQAAAEAAQAAAEAARKAAEAGDKDAALKASEAAASASTAAEASAAAAKAQAAAEAAQKAAEEAEKAAANDKTAAEAAKKAAETAQAAAEAAKTAAEAGDKDAAAKAGEAAASASAAAQAASNAAKAQSAAEAASAKAEAAKAAAEEAQKKGTSAADEAEKAQTAAEAAKKAAQEAKTAAEAAAKAANASDVAAAEAAQSAAAEAAKIAKAQSEIADALAKAAEAAKKAAAEADNAEAAQKAAEAAQKAAEEAAKMVKAAELVSAKVNALTKASLALVGSKADKKAAAAALAAIQNADSAEAVEKALADLLALLAAPADECPSKAFADVPAKGSWAHEGIDFCIKNGYMNGVSDSEFNPAGTVTRAQLVTILYRAAGEPKVEFKGTFTDVAEGKFYSKAVEWAVANNIVKGITETTFEPNCAITREQIAVILYRYSGSPAVKGDLSAYSDSAKAGSYAVDALVWATQEGIITGVKSGNVTALQPKAAATRAQIATIIMRFLEGSFECK